MTKEKLIQILKEIEEDGTAEHNASVKNRQLLAKAASLIDMLVTTIEGGMTIPQAGAAIIYAKELLEEIKKDSK